MQTQTSTANAPFTIPSFFDLSTDAVKIKVSISGSTWKKQDKNAAQETADKHNAEHDRVETVLTMMRKEDRLPIQQIGSAARVWLKERTGRWDDTGWRFIANANYNKIREGLEEFKAKYSEELDKLCARRDELASAWEAGRGSLGDQFSFPTEDEFRAKYTFDVLSEPIVDANDLRLKHISPAAAAEIAASVKQQQGETIQQALKDIVAKLQSAIEHAHTKLADDKQIFRDSTIENIREVCELVPMLNVTNDPWIAKVAKEIAEGFAKVEPEAVREDKEERKKVASAAKGMLERLRAGAVTKNLSAK